MSAIEVFEPPFCVEKEVLNTDIFVCLKTGPHIFVPGQEAFWVLIASDISYVTWAGMQVHSLLAPQGCFTQWLISETSGNGKSYNNSEMQNEVTENTWSANS